MNKTLNTDFLVGKTIKKCYQMEHETHDDCGWIKLIFTDGTECIIEADYYGYTGESLDEYPTCIEILANRPQLKRIVV